MDEAIQGVRQTTMILPHFGYEVPVLYTINGDCYIPVFALCEMLGLHASTHIQRWRKLVLWTNARKLPLRTCSGKRIVWCLSLGALPLWCACFHWSLVNPERRALLHQATDEWSEMLGRVQREMLAYYKYMRHLLFAFLTVYGETDARLSQFELLFPHRLDVDSCMQLERLVFRGRMLIEEAAAHARKMLREQATSPIIDVVTIDPDGEMSEAYSLPLFPVVPREDGERFLEYVSMLTQWYRDMALFLDEKGLSQNKDQG